MKDTERFIAGHKQEFLDDLLTLLRIPSVSADPAYKKDVGRAAEYVASRMRAAGLQKVKIYPTAGHPVVYGERIVDKKLPTVLVYGHYDVQPPDPLELWTSPPFEPVIRKTKEHPDGAVFARGASDDKGQFMMHVAAVRAMIATGELPCNVKMIIEGEEEVGSAHLEDFIKTHRRLLACDVVLISDTSLMDKKLPSLTVGLRGLTYFQVEVTGPNRDLHSGIYGGTVANPINILAGMIARLHDKRRRITIPGFYDKVRRYSKKEREQINSAPFSETKYKRSIGVAELWGEENYTPRERTGIRPSLDVNGIWGGYTGEGAKTVLPSKAYAKISMRLVPDQSPREVERQFVRYFKSLAPKSVKVKVTPMHGGEPALTPLDSPEYQAAERAMRRSFGRRVYPVLEGGSIPIVALFKKVLKANAILMGFGLKSDAIHSPNEHFGLWNYFKGIETIPLFYQEYASSIKN